ncbi:sugar transferase [Flavobacteriales bacterium]|nr:sugar transferase [Flavobacteriales bacterium]
MKKKSSIKYIFLIFDYLSALISWSVFFYFRKTQIENIPFEFTERFYLGLIIIPILWVIGYWLFGSYDNVYRKHRMQVFSKTLISSFTGVLCVFFLFILDDTVTEYSDYYTSFIVLFGLHFILTLIARFILTTIIVKNIHQKKIGFNTIIIGGNEKAFETFNEINDGKNYGGNIFKGYIRVNGKDTILKEFIPELGTIPDLHFAIQNNDIEEIIIAVESNEHKILETIINEIEGYDLIIKIIPDTYDILSSSVKTSSLFGTPFMELKTDILPKWQKRIKRGIDIFLSLIAIVILIPAYLIIPFLIKRSSKGPVLFKQIRIGLHGDEFEIFKFRTMKINSEKNGPQLSSENDPRITKIGRFLRKTRLDEIPQFINVLNGEMSLVGPRPERQFFIDKIIVEAPHYKHLHKVQPGITSWGQVKYGYAENVEEMVQRLKYDMLYIKNQSLSLDFKILLYTVIIVLKRKGK